MGRALLSPRWLRHARFLGSGRAARVADNPIRLVPLALPLLLISLTVHQSAYAHLSLIRYGAETGLNPGFMFANAGDRFGSAVVAGDFDGDGFDDLATGAPNRDNAGAQDGQKHGRVVINRGTIFGLTHVGGYERSFQDNVADNDVRFGYALAVGDFDDDGYDDLVVGAPFRDYLGAADAGSIHIYTGSATGLGENTTVFHQEDLGGLRETDDRFGWALAVGDFNNDGVDDLAIGSPGENSGRGAAFYVHSTAGIGLDPLGAGAGFFTQADLGMTEHDGDHFGHALATGRALGGFIDLVVGAPYDREGSALTPATGRVTIIPGQGAGGLGALGTLNFNAVELGVAGSTIESAFGYALAVGRFAHPGGLPDDIAIGEPLSNTEGVFHSGRAVIYQHGAPTLQVNVGSVPGTSLTPGVEDFFGWAVGVGDLDDDGMDELAVGALGKSAGPANTKFAGNVSIFKHCLGTFPCNASLNADCEWIHDQYRVTGMGWSFAYGHFDSTASGAFAIGAPLADYMVWTDPATGAFVDDNSLDVDQAGQVHVYAPHRQVMQLRSRSAALRDCEGNLIQTQRMFDTLPMASTTKSMTNYIAAEHITHAGSWGLDSLTAVVVPDYIGQCASTYGSSAALVEAEVLTLIDIMRESVMISGNDASLLLGHVLTGQTWAFPDPNPCPNNSIMGEQVPAFSDSMNARAAALGMSSTVFTNPYGSNHSEGGIFARTNAIDFVRLGGGAMKNDVFRMITSTQLATVKRTIPPLNMVQFDDVLFFNFLDGIRDNFPLNRSMVQGIKPGSTPDAMNTGLSAARWANEDDTIASMFGVPNSWIASKMAQLLALGINSCAVVNANVVPVPPPPDADGNLPGVSTDADSTTAMSLGPFETEGDDLLVELYPNVMTTPEAHATLSIRRSLSYGLKPGEAVTLSVTPFESHEGIFLLNENVTAAVNLQIEHNQPLGTSYMLSLPPGEDALVVPASAFPSASLTLTITNLSSVEKGSIHLLETGYVFNVTLGDGLSAPSSFSAQLGATGDAVINGMHIQLTGQDTAAPVMPAGMNATVGAGNTLYVVVREPGTTTGVGGTPRPVPPPGDGIILSPRAFPNPFNPQTTIAFELIERARVSLHMFDARGRLVRTLLSREPREVGEHRLSWDGRNDHRDPVASGVYFFRLSAAQSRVTGKVVLLK